ncbi:MAG: lipoate--protein ligase family protein [Verrucomicrobiia bacterium]|jgi:lipoate-protein ligase A
MKYLDRTLQTPQENLACDEALLDWCEEGFPDEILRFWEPRQHFAVLGYSNKTRSEVNLDSCKRLGVPVLRRCSGGGTVLQGPGCLNYALLLKIQGDSPLTNITKANAFIMNRNRNALNPLLGGKVLIQGHTDLTLQGTKFSGNSQRRRRLFLLFHGSFLLDFDLALIEQTLHMPSKQPPYRRDRAHQDFLTNLHLPATAVKNAMKQIWNATTALDELPEKRIKQLLRDKYATDGWNFKF